jgi:hypothetical protein
MGAMASFSMSGPFPLSHQNIESRIPPSTAGVFVLGTIDSRGSLKVVEALGRSDSDLAGQLKQHVGRAGGFLFQTAPSPTDAFHMECDLYHRMGRADFLHPVRPAATNLLCPICQASSGSSEPTVGQRSILERAKYYRMKARELRETAEEMTSDAKPRVLKLAESYERLAGTMDKMAEPKPAPKK